MNSMVVAYSLSWVAVLLCSLLLCVIVAEFRTADTDLNRRSIHDPALICAQTCTEFSKRRFCLGSMCRMWRVMEACSRFWNRAAGDTAPRILCSLSSDQHASLCSFQVFRTWVAAIPELGRCLLLVLLASLEAHWDGESACPKKRVSQTSLQNPEIFISKRQTIKHLDHRVATDVSHSLPSLSPFIGLSQLIWQSEPLTVSRNRQRVLEVVPSCYEEFAFLCHSIQICLTRVFANMWKNNFPFLAKSGTVHNRRVIEQFVTSEFVHCGGSAQLSSICSKTTFCVVIDPNLELCILHQNEVCSVRDDDVHKFLLSVENLAQLVALVYCGFEQIVGNCESFLFHLLFLCCFCFLNFWSESQRLSLEDINLKLRPWHDTTEVLSGSSVSGGVQITTFIDLY